jgi:hypothetical protein
MHHIQWCYEEYDTFIFPIVCICRGPSFASDQKAAYRPSTVRISPCMGFCSSFHSPSQRPSARAAHVGKVINVKSTISSSLGLLRIIDFINQYEGVEWMPFADMAAEFKAGKI